MASRIGGICSPFVVFLVSCVGSKYFRLVELELDDTRVPPGEWGGGYYSLQWTIRGSPA